jgi:hypothetical protein
MNHSFLLRKRIKEYQAQTISIVRRVDHSKDKESLLEEKA